ncbi:response regulator [Blastopirellula marina]|uniref:Two-component system response regulator n=1 Tax=Blastopirellula marina TaxID=124 RepID=A0A2S8GE30_9BACT|nr:response regulator [Blastopirellula marina]PQO42501.1 two-component system response regulator [Blastopirellula marina]
MRESNHFILVVEDDPLMADITAFRLELLGFRVETVENADAALRICQEHSVDLVIIDLELAGLKGLELINQLQIDEATHETPILAFSTDPALDVVQKAFKAGAKDYLVTPYDPAVLEHKIARLISPEQVTSK